MSMDVLAEEFEVLESIYPTELTKFSDKEIHIIVEPDEQVDGLDELRLLLKVKYPEGYPDNLPELTLDALDGALEEKESKELMVELQTIGEENIGIAMTFTIVSHLREKLLSLLHTRADRLMEEAKEKERLELEAEEARTRGTPVTAESFLVWKTKFDKEMAACRLIEQEERLKGLPPKERDELRKIGTRLTGRQLFERDRNLALSDAALIEDGTTSIDISQYDRTANESEPEENEILQLSDSD
ncbi:RWD-domain-containing protein [Hysterangium stoloniferum]|nr:RWD-domain-containing protein [Hysterangium stoloniferum]